MKRITAALMAFLTAASAWADTRKAVEEGQKLFEQHKYAEAHERFNEAAADLPESPLLEFNKAATFYKRQDYDKATELYRQSLLTKDPQLEAAAKYNLGNCEFQQAVMNQSDLGKAIEMLDRAMVYYRDAIETLADPQKARYNLEKAKLLEKALIDKKKKEMEQQKKEQQNEDRQKDKEQEDQNSNGDKKEQNQEEQQTSQKDEAQKDQQTGQSKQEQKRELSAEEAEKLLNAIRERQKEDERARRIRRPAGYVPVDKDW